MVPFPHLPGADDALARRAHLPCRTRDIQVLADLPDPERVRTRGGQQLCVRAGTLPLVAGGSLTQEIRRPLSHAT